MEVNKTFRSENKFSIKFLNEYVIVNADDLGLCEERDKGIFELFEKKAISSASIMVNGSSFESAILQSKRLNMPLGIHLNLTEGEPINKMNLESNTLVGIDSNTKCYSMHGKFKLRELIDNNKINMNDVKNELISQVLSFLNQILLFIKTYQGIPDHFDGHQHIHVIPSIAEVIANLASNYFGIYCTRNPIESEELLNKFIKDTKRMSFYKLIITQSEMSSKIYSENLITFPEKFVGMSIMGSTCTEENLIYVFDKIRNESQNIINPYHIEYMCHPGYPSKDYWDDFNTSNERLFEKNSIENFFTNKKFNLASFSNLSVANYSSLNIVIVGDLTYGTGNSISAKRLKTIFTSLNYPTYIFNVKYLNSTENLDIDISILKNFIVQKRINLIIGINLWRAGRIINCLMNKFVNDIYLDLKYFIILAGTDANIFINDSEKYEIMKRVVLKSEKVISFNQQMIEKLKKKIDNFNSYLIIPQSVSVGVSKFSLRKIFNIPQSKKITLLPSSIRAVKDPIYLLPVIIDIFRENADHYFFILGARFDEKIYLDMRKIIKDANSDDRIIILDVVEHNDFINILKEVDLVVNSSISEGMSNAIMEAMILGIPVLARENEGNLTLIKHMNNGLIFSNLMEFRELYLKIYNDQELRKIISNNSINQINEKFSIDFEIEKYINILNEFKQKNYIEIKNSNYDTLNLIVSRNELPFSVENNEVLNNALGLKNEFTEINLLDVRCDSGILSIIFMLNNKHIKINEIVLSDTNEISLSNAYQNLMYYKEYLNFKKLTIIRSNLMNELVSYYVNQFDIILVNLPQIPSIEKIDSKNIINFRWKKR